MLASAAAERARRRIARMCHIGLDAPTLLRELAAAVRPVVGYDGAVWATTDPATVLITGAHVEELPRESAPAFYENEYLHDDVIKFSRLARGLRPVTTLSEATQGVLSRSRLHRELAPAFGFRGDALRAAFVAGGSCWGAAALVRRDPRTHFTQADVSFMAAIGAHVAEGLRAATLLVALGPPPAHPPAIEPPGIVILDGERVRAASSSAEAWLEELRDDFEGAGRTHSALLAVAAAAGRIGDEGEPASPPAAVMRTRAGRWLGLHGVRLETDSGRPEIAVILEAARPPQLTAVVMSAYGLTARERDVAQQVISGASTAEASAALHISPYTLQDHLKSIFDKVGVRSRAELTKEVFDRHYAAAGRLGGGPRPGPGARAG
jgi:DNA-binding CsgD family transcriptional regulator